PSRLRRQELAPTLPLCQEAALTGHQSRSLKNSAPSAALARSTPFLSAIPLTLATKMRRRLWQHSRNSELFHGRSLAGLQITENAETLHGISANCRCGD